MLLSELRNISEGIDNITNAEEPDSDYALPKPKKKIKKSARNQATTDKAMNSLIKTLWFYNASDVT